MVYELCFFAISGVFHRFVLGMLKAGTYNNKEANLKKPATMKVALTLILCVLCTSAFSQNIGINVNGAAPHPSALLDVDASAAPLYKRGILVPRMTTAERDGIVSPATSLLIFNTDENCYQFFKGVGWSGCMAEEKTCPTGMVDMGLFSIEFNQRLGADWYSAADTCRSYGMRLCNVDEWSFSCRSHFLGNVTLGGMDNEYEWVRENGVGNYMRVQGYLSCVNSTEVSYLLAFQFRCCCDH